MIKIGRRRQGEPVNPNWITFLTIYFIASLLAQAIKDYTAVQLGWMDFPANLLIYILAVCSAGLLFLRKRKFWTEGNRTVLALIYSLSALTANLVLLGVFAIIARIVPFDAGPYNDVVKNPVGIAVMIPGMLVGSLVNYAVGHATLRYILGRRQKPTTGPQRVLLSEG